MECESDVCRIILAHGFPIGGFLTNALLVTAPLKLVQQIRTTESLGPTNTFPFTMMMMNALSWIVYGFYIKDIYVFSPNIVGYAFSIYYILGSLPYQSKISQEATILRVITLSTIILIGGAVGFIFFQNNPAQTQLVLGSICCFNLIIFYSSPLSDLADIIRLKDSSSIDPKLAFAALINSALWTVYAVVISDLFVFGPNAVGFLFSIVQLAILGIYKQERASSPTLSEGYEPIHVNSNE
ncbi:sugar efflux transporter for intercellular exchange-domain-containing protein [Globomyces pollinis-pini]|nr:sugar efflux transporter for intercellular exchange-domain-containing protein [Globomyces pollinis-pini]